MRPDLPEILRQHIRAYEHPARIPLSRRLPRLKRPLIAMRRTMRKGSNLCDRRIARKRSTQLFPCVIARHQSVLLRTLGTTDMRLQHNKVFNLRAALPSLQGLVIQPGETFSFWETIGKPKSKRGFVPGMLLSDGFVTEGIGGGLCQLSNFLFWLFLHAETEIVERHHHSLDVFPDSGRILPFGSGATVFFNYVDLKVRNSSPYPLQIHLWLTDKFLKGQIVSPAPAAKKYHVIERDACFVRKGTRYFRFNTLWREVFDKGLKTDERLVAQNFAPVLYEVNDTYLRGRTVIALDEIKSHDGASFCSCGDLVSCDG